MWPPLCVPETWWSYGCSTHLIMQLVGWDNVLTTMLFLSLFQCLIILYIYGGMFSNCFPIDSEPCHNYGFRNKNHEFLEVVRLTTNCTSKIKILCTILAEDQSAP